MTILKLITTFLLTILPIAVLVRDWKFHDKRTKRHHNITRAIIVFWCICSIVAAIFVWVDSARIKELIDGKNKLIDQSDKLSAKIDKYQKDLDEKEQKIKELETQAQDAKHGITRNYYASGSILETRGTDIKHITKTPLRNTFKQMEDLQEKKQFHELLAICKEQINNCPDWYTPYIFLGIALYNLGEKDNAIKQFEYFLKIAPTQSMYGYESYRTQAEEFIKKLKNK